jgi:citrate lyase subunit beta/citryl-CoA lyase
VPGSNPRFLEKAQGLPADQVFLDLEDACAPLVKESARHAIVDALNTGDWGGKTRVVRVNDWTTQWTYRDVVTVVEGAGQNLDCVMLPKVQDAGQVTALDLLLTQIEKAMGFEVGREVPMLLIGEGTAEIQKMIVGRRLLEEYRTDS